MESINDHRIDYNRVGAPPPGYMYERKKRIKTAKGK